MKKEVNSAREVCRFSPSFTRRMLAIFMVFVMCLSALPMTAFAADATVDEGDFDDAFADDATIDEGDLEDPFGDDEAAIPSNATFADLQAAIDGTGGDAENPELFAAGLIEAWNVGDVRHVKLGAAVLFDSASDKEGVKITKKVVLDLNGNNIDRQPNFIVEPVIDTETGICKSFSARRAEKDAAGNVVSKGEVVKVSEAKGGTVISITKDGNLTLKDSAATGSAETGTYKSGKITGAMFNGACVGINNLGTFTMDGGEVSGNMSNMAATGSGVLSVGTFVMNGGQICKNYGDTGNGGAGVGVSRGTFTMNGGAIVDNVSVTHAGGIISMGAPIVINGGLIARNRADNTRDGYGYGAGIFSVGSVTINGGSIAENVGSYGAGVAMFGGTLTMTGGKVEKNSARIAADDIYSDKPVTLVTGSDWKLDNEAARGDGVVAKFYKGEDVEADAEGDICLKAEAPKTIAIDITAAYQAEYTASENGLPAAELRVTLNGEAYDKFEIIGYKDAEGERLSGMPKDAGKYFAVVSVMDEAGESLAERDIEFAIIPAVLTAKYEGETVTLGNEPLYEIAVEGFVGDEDADTAEDYIAPTLDTSKVDVETAGEYQLMPAGGSAKNYTFEYESGVLQVLEPAAKIVEASCDYEAVYTGLKQELPADAVKVTVDSVETKDFEIVGYDADPIDAGEYTAKLVVAGSETVEVKFAIKQAVLTVKTESAEKVYDGEALTAEGSVAGLVNDETVTFQVTGSQTEVGTSDNDYMLVWDGSAKEANYEIAESIGKLTVTEAGNEPPVDPEPVERELAASTEYTAIYNGSEQMPSKGDISVTVDGEAWNSFEIKGLKGDVKPVDGDTYKLVLSVLDENGEEIGVAYVEYVIKPAVLTVKTESASKVYDGEALTAGGEVIGLVNDETVTLQIDGSQTEVGNSENSYTLIWDGSAKESNYEILESVGTLTVTEKEEPVEPTEPALAAKVTRRLVYTSHEQILFENDLAVTVDGKKVDSFKITGYKTVDGKEIGTFKNAGNYIVTIEVKDDKGEALGNLDVGFTVNPALLTARYISEFLNVGNVPRGDVLVTGFVGAENPRNIPGYKAPWVDMRGIDHRRPGVYTLTPMGGAAANYAFEYIAGILEFRGDWDYTKHLLSVRKTVDGDKTVKQGDTVVYSIFLENVGKTTVRGVTISDVLNKNLTFKDASIGVKNAKDIEPNKYGEYKIGTLKPGDFVKLSIAVKVNDDAKVGEIKNTAYVEYSGMGKNETISSSVIIKVEKAEKPAQTQKPVQQFPVQQPPVQQTPIQQPVQTPVVAPNLNTVDHFAYITGYADGTVRPEANITRGEVATIFYRLMTEEYRTANMSTNTGFFDMGAGVWCNNAVATCVHAGLILGYNDHTFKPSATITRAEFAAIASRFLSGEVSNYDVFSDMQGHWAKEAVAKAAAAGWIQGSNGMFRPNDKITRAEVMAVVNRMLGRNPHRDYMAAAMMYWPDNNSNAWYYEAVQEATNSHACAPNSMNGFEVWTSLIGSRDWSYLESVNSGVNLVD